MNAVRKRPTKGPGTSSVFISHYDEDAELAEAFSALLRNVSSGIVKAFWSSDKTGAEGLLSGEDWYPELRRHLRRTGDVVCLLTRQSHSRPWLLYEAGFAKALRVPVHGLALGLPLKEATEGPFGQFQNVAYTREAITGLVNTLVSRLPSANPNTAAIRTQVAGFMRKVDKVLKAREASSPPGAVLPAQFLSRDDVARTLPSVRERLKAARRLVLISGNDCKYVVESQSSHLEQALKRGTEIHIMCVDPIVPGLSEMLASVDPRFDNADDFKGSMVSVERQLRKLQARYPSLLKIGYLPVLPAIGFFIVDPDLPGGSMKIELYTPKPWKPLDTRAHILLPPEWQTWREYFLQMWKNYWALAISEPTEAVIPVSRAGSVPGNS